MCASFNNEWTGTKQQFGLLPGEVELRLNPPVTARALQGFVGFHESIGRIETMRYEIHHDAVLPQRAVTFLGIAALHVFFVYLFMSGLAQSAFKEILDTTAVLIDESPVADEAPPVIVREDYVPPQGELVEPDIRIDDPPQDSGTALTNVTSTPHPTPTSGTAAITPPPEPIQLVGTNRIPNAESYYPASLKRQGVEGATVVKACVDERGRLQGEPVVQRSSGYEGFDKGAVEAARDGRYARATQGGRPVPNCYSFRISFVISAR
jgi:TonB family protein